MMTIVRVRQKAVALVAATLLTFIAGVVALGGAPATVPLTRPVPIPTPITSPTLTPGQIAGPVGLTGAPASPGTSASPGETGTGASPGTSGTASGSVAGVSSPPRAPGAPSNPADVAINTGTTPSGMVMILVLMHGVAAAVLIMTLSRRARNV